MERVCHPCRFPHEPNIRTVDSTGVGADWAAPLASGFQAVDASGGGGGGDGRPELALRP